MDFWKFAECSLAGSLCTIFVQSNLVLWNGMKIRYSMMFRLTLLDQSFFYSIFCGLINLDNMNIAYRKLAGLSMLERTLHWKQTATTMTLSTWPSYDVLATSRYRTMRYNLQVSPENSVLPEAKRHCLSQGPSVLWMYIGWCCKFGLHAQRNKRSKHAQVYIKISYLELRFSRCRQQLAELLELGPSGPQSTKPAKFLTCKLRLAKT